MPSPTVPLSVENEAMLGATGAAVSTVTPSAAEATPVLPAASVAVAVRLWAPLASAAVVIAPGAGAVRGGAAEQRGAVVDLDRAVGFRRAGQRQGVVIGDAVANRAAVGRERGDARGNRRRRIDGDAQRGRGHAGIAGRIGGGGGQAVGAIGKRSGRVAPGAGAIGGGAAEQRRTVVDLDRALASAVPVSVRVLSLVMPSPTVPLSVENEAMVGATGAVVSTVTLSAAEAALVLPAASVAVAVRLWAPLASAAVV